MRKVKSPLDRQLARHAVEFVARCDVVDSAGRGWPVTISSMRKELFIGLLLLTPHCEGGKKLCAALNKGDVVRYRLGFCYIFDARVAAKGDVAGSVWLHAVDVGRNLIRPVSVRGS